METFPVWVVQVFRDPFWTTYSNGEQPRFFMEESDARLVMAQRRNSQPSYMAQERMRLVRIGLPCVVVEEMGV